MVNLLRVLFAHWRRHAKLRAAIRRRRQEVRLLQEENEWLREQIETFRESLAAVKLRSVRNGALARYQTGMLTVPPEK